MLAQNAGFRTLNDRIEAPGVLQDLMAEGVARFVEWYRDYYRV